MTKLEYEAYTSLALKTLHSLLEDAHTPAPFAENPIPRSENAAPVSNASTGDSDRITRCYIAHRLGEVSVGECSILIAVSSPHRKEAFTVAEWLLEETKRNVAVWKCEFYASGDTVTALDGEDAQIEPKQLNEVQGSGPVEGKKDAQESWSWKANFPTA